MIKELNVNAIDYPNDVRVNCEKCHSELLIMVHKDCQLQICTLGCAFCGHPNQIKLGE